MAEPRIDVDGLPFGVSGPFDTVVGVDESTGAARRFPMPQAGTPRSYATRASLPAASGFADGYTVWVNNDPTPANNGTWAVLGGVWVQSADRVSGLEAWKAEVEPKVESTYSAIRQTDVSDLATFTDADGWVRGSIASDGSLTFSGYSLLSSDDAFVVIDEDGWIVFDAATATANSDDGGGAWSGLSYLLFGDSITETANVEAGQFGLGYRSNWPAYAYQMLQMGDLKNYARSGASFREYGQADWQKISHQIDQAAINGVLPDVVIVSCGTNDGSASLGSFSAAMAKTSLASLDRSLTLEAARWAFWTIRTEFPAATCFFALPIQRASNEQPEALIDGLRALARRYNFVVIDGSAESGIVRDFEQVGAAGRDLSDGLHPNVQGQKKMAHLYASVVKRTITD